MQSCLSWLAHAPTPIMQML